MKSHVLRILKGSQRPGKCRGCRRGITWAVCAPRGKSVPLVAAPIVLRHEQTDGGVRFDVVGSDQVHACAPARGVSRLERVG